MTATVTDVTEATFTRDVIERSHEVPVVVDFWAEWCGPCHQLSPMLERYAQRHAGEVEVVKVDVDANPRLAQAFRVQGIPAVKALRGGRIVAEFTGVQPEASVARFFEALAPSAADRLVARAAGEPPAAAAATLEQALAEDPGHAGAIVALARIQADEGDLDGARGLLARAPHDPEAERLAAELALADRRVDDAELGRLRAAVEAGDAAARVDLGRALAAGGRVEEAVEVLLAAVTDPATREPAREVLVELFTTLGDDHDLVRASRPRLARALF